MLLGIATYEVHVILMHFSCALGQTKGLNLTKRNDTVPAGCRVNAVPGDDEEIVIATMLFPGQALA